MVSAVGLVHLGQHPLVAMGRDDVVGHPGTDFPPADHRRDVGLLGAHGGERRLEGRSLGSSRRIAQHRLVVGDWDVRGTAHHFTGDRGSGKDNQNSPAGGCPGPPSSGLSSSVKPLALRMAWPSGEKTNRTNACGRSRDAEPRWEW